MTVGDPPPTSSPLPNANDLETSSTPDVVASDGTNASTTEPKSVSPHVTAKPLIGRMTGPLAARGLGIVRPLSPQSPADVVVGEPFPPDRKRLRENGKKNKAQPRHRLAGETQGSSGADESDSTTTTAAQAGEGVTATPRGGKPKVAVPNRRQGLPADIQAELDAELAAADVTSILSGSAGMPDRREPLGEGSRVQAKILKIHEDSVFVSLGGPDEGVVPFEQFTGAEPTIGQMVEVLVRGFNRDDGLYVLTIPGQAIDVSDWSDIEEGAVVEATITAANTGGVECTVGGARGFIPISQLSEHRVEDATEFIGRKLMCVVTEANQRRGNLVLSHRATLEREREDRKREQLEKFEAGLELEGTVRSIKDFGAFIDLGGLDGMVHISKLSWERIKHPSEVLEAGQKVRVVIEKIDKQSGKISLSYRDLLVNPWDTAEATFQPGTVHQGEITRTANFGAFVRLAPGVEGLVHISELAHHRVSKVDSIVSVGQNVEVKVLSFDRNTQKISLSMKATLAKPEVEGEKPAPEEVDEPVREMAVKQHVGPLKGGNNRDTGGERFGLRW